MHGIRVGVLRGGPSKEHDVSLKTGHAIVANLPKEEFSVKDIYIDRAGVWHDRGLPTTPERALRQLDAVVIGLHGEFGEDGEVQKLLKHFGVPFTGSDALSSFTSMHKVFGKEKAKEHGIKTPEYRYFEEGSDIEEMAEEVIRTFHQPVVVKPVRWGSSVGVSFVSGFSPLVRAVEHLLSEGAGGVLVEERIIGVEATVGVVEEFRGEALYAMPPVEIIPPGDDFFSYGAKYGGETRELCPGRFHTKVRDELVDSAKIMHEAMHLSHYSRSDFMVSKKGVYYLETNTLPGLTEESLFPKSLSAVGITMPYFLSHIVGLALHGKRR